MQILLTLCYDGKHFCGYQVQPNGRTVQAVMQDAIEALYGERLDVVGCSRTDSGVHARDFKMTFAVTAAHPQILFTSLPAALNRHLPRDIAVTNAEAVSDGFHVRHHVVSKEYEYQIYNAPVRSPFYEGFAYHVPQTLDIERMNAAARYFCGTHDFAGFMAAGSDVADTVRTIYHASVTKDGALVRFRVSGNGFLYNMVRIMTGTLLAVGLSKKEPQSVLTALEARDRALAGVTVPPDGLYLNRVTLDVDKMKIIDTEGRDTGE